MNAGPSATAESCPRCGEERPAGARYCARCGLDLTHPSDAVAGPGPGQVPESAPLPVVGRRASRAGWAAVLVGSLSFLVVSLAIIAATGSTRVATGPVARWDTLLYDGSTVTEGQPFTIDVEVVNPGTSSTDALWVLIDWHPADRVSTPGAVGTLRSCVPASCRFRDDVAAGTTIAWWPGLAAGVHQASQITVAVVGIEPGGTFRYRVTTGTGPDERSIVGGHRWDLDLDVQ